MEPTYLIIDKDQFREFKIAFRKLDMYNPRIIAMDRNYTRHYFMVKMDASNGAFFYHLSQYMK